MPKSRIYIHCTRGSSHDLHKFLGKALPWMVKKLLIENTLHMSNRIRINSLDIIYSKRKGTTFNRIVNIQKDLGLWTLQDA